MSNWNYIHDEEIFDDNPNYIGVIADDNHNLLFYHGYTNGDDEEIEEIFTTLNDLMVTGEFAVCFPWSAENEEKFINFLNSLDDKKKIYSAGALSKFKVTDYE